MSCFFLLFLVALRIFDVGDAFSVVSQRPSNKKKFSCRRPVTPGCHPRYSDSNGSCYKDCPCRRLGSLSARSIDLDTPDLVNVEVEEILPDATPEEAKEAWLEHHWRRGGGLPILLIGEQQDTKDDEQAILSRWIVPIMMKETLQEFSGEEDTNNADKSLRYVVSSPGLFGLDLVPNSHSGIVKFEPVEQGGCRMTWTVTFQVERFQALYQAVTEWTIGTAARTVSEAVALPRLLTLTTTIDANPNDVLDVWLHFFWKDGGGLPLLPVIPYGEVLPSTDNVRKSFLRVPPFLKDNVVSTTSYRPNDNNFAEACYSVENPGYATIPFFMHTHFGRARFVPAQAGEEVECIDLTWQVQIRPYQVARPLVEWLTETTISTVIRNIKVRCMEPGKTVTLAPPRGAGGGDVAFGEIPKETWLGGVLHAHLSDTRSTLEQMLSLFQPWTWGRSGTGDPETDDVVFQWSDARMDR